MNLLLDIIALASLTCATIILAPIVFNQVHILLTIFVLVPLVKLLELFNHE